VSAADEAVSARRLGTAPTDHTESFTVDRAQALQRQRHRPGATRWSWTLQVLRALFALTDGARVIASPPRGTATAGLRLRFGFDLAALHGIEMHGLLDAALEPDDGPGDGALATRQRRFVRLLARGINESLAFGPCRVEVRVASRVHRFEIGDGEEHAVEHVEDVARSPEIDAWPLEIEVVIERLVGRWFEAVLGSDGFQETLKIWFARVPGLDLSVEPAVLRPVPHASPLRLGQIGAWWPTGESKPLALLRDGVLLATALARDLAVHGLTVRDFAGVIEAPSLRLTFDEASVVLDPQLTKLVAWLGDVRAHASRLPLPLQFDDLLLRSGKRRYEGRIIGAVWPPTIDRVQTVVGEWVYRQGLEAAAQDGVELAYCWAHERADVPEHLRQSTLMLWPREHEALQMIPNLRLVPFAAYDVASVSDWGTLAQISFPEVPLGTIARSRDVPARIDVGGLVHRRAAATAGRIELADGGAMIAEIRDPARVLPGVVIIGRVVANEGATGRLTPSARHAALQAIEAHARANLHVLIEHARLYTTDGDDAALLRAVAPDNGASLATPTAVAVARATSTKPPLMSIDVTLRDYGGVLHVLDVGERGEIEVWRAGQSCGRHMLAEPWSRIAGDLAVSSPTTPIDVSAIAQVVGTIVVPDVERMWALAAPGGEMHTSLAELASRTRVDVAPAAPVELPPPAPEPITLHTVLSRVLGIADLRIDSDLTWTPAAMAGATTVKIGTLNPWTVGMAGVHYGREDVALAAVLSIVTLAHDELTCEGMLLRYLAVFSQPPHSG
jgi:hypothetical protein